MKGHFSGRMRHLLHWISIMLWHPHVTVATIVQKDDRFLMVEEDDNGRRVFNQPAGHLEDHESLLEAARRETLEETRWQVALTGFLGVYHYRSASGTNYIRHCFTATALEQTDNPLDSAIHAVHWLSADEILASNFAARSIAVQKVLRDYLTRKPLPLEAIHYENEAP